MFLFSLSEVHFSEARMKRVSTRKYDSQSFPEMLEAIKTGKYIVKKPDGIKYKQKETWEKWCLVYDEADQLVKDFFYCRSCSTIYNLILANSGRCLKTHAAECVGAQNTDSRIDNHFTTVFDPTKRRKISQEDKFAVKEASINFVVGDMRPISSIKGDGLMSLLSTMTRIGAKYGEMSEKALTQSRVVPGRQTVRYSCSKS